MNEPSTPKFSLARALVRFLLYVLLFAFVPLLISGRWDWLAGWLYAILTVVAAVISRLLMFRYNPDLVQERGRFMDQPEAKPWDKKLAPIVGLIGPMATMIVAGVDARYHWTPPLPAWLFWKALIIFILGYIFSSWALIENRFFSGVVRIQTERGHHVVDSGPYRIVRHPGYAGGMWVFLFTPILLGSLWGLIPAILTLAAMIVRTALEDQTLQNELPGYREYTQKTRYRLLPLIW